ncbi:hypothetical protein [Endozoicomonas sp. 8E]|uniref:hypothetical protein n=1 Tax=Endozoicomonas sp. 8E TaxID=3035692 RepID=UPI0029394AEC|nr:hypothetical protein [Endozoicomonas sp. 8E]WOG26932.1 hypothetical protein P6910_20640 [Endozoicomonas sp. 8E]
MSLLAICQAKPLTRRFIVEFEQNAGFPNRNFSIKIDRHTLSENPSNTVEINDCPEPDLPSNDIRQKTYSCRVKTTLIDSISWQWLYTINLLVVYELILTRRDISSSSNLYSWVSPEAVIAVSWLLKSDWNPDSSLFNAIETQKAVTMLTLLGHPFATITAMYGSGNSQQQSRPSVSPGQKARKTTTHRKGSLNSLMITDCGDGDKSPQRHLHTLGLNCFIHPCYGVCQLRQLSNSRGSAELEYQQPNESLTTPVAVAEIKIYQSGETPRQGSCPHLVVGYCFSCMPHFNFLDAKDSHQNSPLGTLGKGSVCETDSAGQATCDVILIGKDGQQQPCRKVLKNAKYLQKHKRSIHTGPQTCKVTMVAEDGQERYCGKLCKHLQALWDHKRRDHFRPKICNAKVVTAVGQQQQCGEVCKNARALLDHMKVEHTWKQTCNETVAGRGGKQRPCGKTFIKKNALWHHRKRQHSGQQTCNVTMIGGDGRLRPCGKVCKSVQAMSSHKSRYHGLQRTCDVTVTGEDGQPCLCGVVCKSANALSDHKRNEHTGQQTCDAIVVGKDGQKRPCEKVFKSLQAFSVHKSKYHTGQKICDATVIGKDGRSQPCRKTCKHLQALCYHKRKNHSGQQTFDATLIEEYGQQRAGGNVCSNAAAPLNHKRSHRKRKLLVGQGDDLLSQESKVKK